MKNQTMTPKQATPAKTNGGKTQLLSVPVKLRKSTPGTHVLADQDSGLSFYIPRLYFTMTGIEPSSNFRLTIERE